MPVSEVTSADVLEILAPIWHTKADTARRLRQRIRAVLEWAVAMEFRIDNPCDRIDPVLGPQGDVVQHMRALPHGEVAAAIRTLEEFARARAILGGWAEASGPAEPDAEIREEIDRIERAILQGAIQILDEFGGLQAALKRSVALTKQERQQRGRGPIHTGRTWQTVRLSGAHFR